MSRDDFLVNVKLIATSLSSTSSSAFDPTSCLYWYDTSDITKSDLSLLCPDMRCLFNWKWLLPLTLLYLYYYVVQNVCPQYAFNLKTTDISSKSPSAIVCLWHDQVALPAYSHYVLPVQQAAAEKWTEVDSKFKISETVCPKVAIVALSVSQTYKEHVQPVVSHLSRQLIIFYYGSVVPHWHRFTLWTNAKSVEIKLAAITWYYKTWVPLASKAAVKFNSYYALAEVKVGGYLQIAYAHLYAYYSVALFKTKIYYSALSSRVSIYSSIVLNYILVKWNIFVDSYVSDDVRELFGAWFDYVRRAYHEVVRVFVILRQKTHDFTLDHKNKFVKTEFKDLLKFSDFKKSISPSLLEFTQKFLKLERTLEKEASDDSDSESGDSDEEPIHSTIVSTIIVTRSNGEIAPSAQPDAEVGQPNEIDAEVAFWSEKINKTLQLASDNLKAEMTPKADSSINQIKGEILDLLQKIQVSNHNQYKVLNIMIADIHKDYEAIVDGGNKTVIESVSREQVREEFQRTYNETDLSSGRIQNILIEAHSKVVEEYYETVQATIDIIQLFAENTLQDYLNFLNNLPSELDETYSWGLWKRFYQSKEDIYKFRDELFNQFNAYKEQPKKAETPIGLDKWAEYLRNIEFTLNYLIRDNTEYLRLARARANLAFQLREELVSQIEAAEAAEKAVEEVEEPVIEDSIPEEPVADEPVVEELIEDAVEVSADESVVEPELSVEESQSEPEIIDETVSEPESEAESVIEETPEPISEESSVEEISSEESATEEFSGVETEESAPEISESETEESSPESVAEDIEVEESATEISESEIEEPSTESVAEESFTEEIETEESAAEEESVTEEIETESESEETSPKAELASSAPIEAVEIKEPALESPDAKEPDTQEPDVKEEVPEL